MIKSEKKTENNSEKKPAKQSQKKNIQQKEFSYESSVKAIGFVSSPFKEKFGIPRQPGLMSQAKGIIKLNPDPDLKTALRSLEQFSHLWIVFVFHQHGGHKWKPSIRPPRLGGNVKVGVLASRSPHRPNPIGISAVAIEKIDLDAINGPEIFVSGVDLLDGTPVLDIKPYIPYADSIPEANAGWAAEPIKRHTVVFNPEALVDLCEIEKQSSPAEAEGIKSFIFEMLELDPRPASQQRRYPVDHSDSIGLEFGFDLLGFDVSYQIGKEGFVVVKIREKN